METITNVLVFQALLQLPLKIHNRRTPVTLQEHVQCLVCKCRAKWQCLVLLPRAGGGSWPGMQLHYCFLEGWKFTDSVPWPQGCGWSGTRAGTKGWWPRAPQWLPSPGHLSLHSATTPQLLAGEQERSNTELGGLQEMFCRRAWTEF